MSNFSNTPLWTVLALVTASILPFSCGGDSSPNGPDTGNRSPVLSTIGARSAYQDINLSFVVSAVDPDGPAPELRTGSLPSGAGFVDNGDGSGLFDWTPVPAQLGIYDVTFHATDDSAAVDSEVVRITVTRPGSRVVAVNGLYYKQDVGETGVSPELQFAIADNQNNYFPNQWVHFTVIEGDGALSADSAVTDGAGIATIGYAFAGDLGHAAVRAIAPDRDPVDVILRRSCLVPGAGGQGQYLLLNEDYGMIQVFNGPPEVLVVHPFESWLFVADYEYSLGVVFVMEDVDRDGIAHDNEPILEIIVNDNEDTDPSNDYKGTTGDSVGIGSSIQDVIAVYGEPSSVTADKNPPPPYWRYMWVPIGLTCYTDYVLNESDRFVHEIHLARITSALSLDSTVRRIPARSASE